MKIGILSDIHGNKTALETVYEYLKMENIDKMILLGDLIDYCPHSNEVIKLIKAMPFEIICNIKGNHEEAILNEKYDKFSSERGRKSAKYTKSILEDESWDYIKNIMDQKTYFSFCLNGKKCLAIHGSIEDKAWKAIKPGQYLGEYSKYDYVFSGHSHIPHFFSEFYEDDNLSLRNKKKTVFINPGSVGQPRNHNPGTQFVIWDTDSDEFKFCSLKYDLKKEQEAFSEEVDIFYRDRLAKGV